MNNFIKSVPVILFVVLLLSGCANTIKMAKDSSEAISRDAQAGSPWVLFDLISAPITIVTGAVVDVVTVGGTVTADDLNKAVKVATPITEAALQVAATSANNQDSSGRGSGQARRPTYSASALPTPRSLNVEEASQTRPAGSGFVYDTVDTSGCWHVAPSSRTRLKHTNTCGYPIVVQFCVVTDYSSSYSEFVVGGRCPGGWSGINVAAYGSYDQIEWGEYHNYQSSGMSCREGWSIVSRDDGNPNIYYIQAGGEPYRCRKLS